MFQYKPIQFTNTKKDNEIKLKIDLILFQFYFRKTYTWRQSVISFSFLYIFNFMFILGYGCGWNNPFWPWVSKHHISFAFHFKVGIIEFMIENPYKYWLTLKGWYMWQFLSREEKIERVNKLREFFNEILPK